MARDTAPVTAGGLVDLLDRVVGRGAVVTGDLLVCLAGIDLLRVDLRLLLVSVDTALEATVDGAVSSGRRRGVSSAVTAPLDHDHDTDAGGLTNRAPAPREAP
ncbi:MAG: gas vesicle protein GvpJ [Actinomycetes bacterium]